MILVIGMLICRAVPQSKLLNTHQINKHKQDGCLVEKAEYTAFQLFILCLTIGLLTCMTLCRLFCCLSALGGWMALTLIINYLNNNNNTTLNTVTMPVIFCSGIKLTLQNS